MVARIIPKTQLRRRIKDELAALGEDTLVITEHGRPVAVAVSVERWNSLQQSLEDLEDAVAVLENRRSGRRGRPAESVFAQIETDQSSGARVSRPDRQTG
jgi:prevent-host-death family protein